jgi:hypothetical protein
MHRDTLSQWRGKIILPFSLGRRWPRDEVGGPTFCLSWG